MVAVPTAAIGQDQPTPAVPLLEARRVTIFHLLRITHHAWCMIYIYMVLNDSRVICVRQRPRRSSQPLHENARKDRLIQNKREVTFKRGERGR